MSLYTLSHLWEVEDVEDGISVRLTPRDLDVQTLSILADELTEIALESGRPNLYLDFGRVNLLTSVVIGKLFAVNRRLREAGGRLLAGEQVAKFLLCREGLRSQETQT